MVIEPRPAPAGRLPFLIGAWEQLMSNTFIGRGNLGKAPELKTIQGANGPFEVATMRVMFGRYSTNNQTGDIEQVGGFWREVEIYGVKAKECARLLKKGARVLVIGEEREFTAHDTNDNEVQVLKIVAQDVALQLTRIESISFNNKRDEETAELAAA
jgi:single-strand DNA-binding protein